uniref:IMS import disulfide relay-system CHCH-CHCH-like Cx9C domain-containing protein n=1 Tax=Arion vulgaris TaxID=1028688 RepID=A0A0B7ABG6_9EUPU
MKSVTNARQRMLHYPEALAKCATQATAYGKCVTVKENIRKSDCIKEFEALKDCIKNTMKQVK